ncbi:acetolactate synthase-1/2/3 large subunit/5-guanidino-2-oxopentanoate decarboxylase [Yoonia maricola]|uniref:Acetolactate synthase-1/2/3 large subunit/5-guanidino-2-oxopentanoate decarboxylase n=1 Tax=Yoonia maricola TaxID=420999 RepID=A0A2M8WKD4_9RHOB|nr:5-guanidino-2-oxopentanoate decarboxylase [Yoonia maricola]PJI91368.1 acetolactate synthase-1/2/3 large subunit/5-guanidino-2-oxopentanoate decarboxylase [Yoonia maricola]
MTTRPLGAQISHMLKDRGVDVIFGIPGVHNQEMYRGIEEAGITHVLARHEQGAGFMADGYARATGKPGVAYVISGPGLCNIMTPMAQAYSDSVPMLVISSVLDETEAKRGQLHQMKDQEGAAATVCDWSVTARTAEAAYQLIDRALMQMQTGVPSPKHIQVPIAGLEGRAQAAPARPADWPMCPEPVPLQCATLTEQLKGAKRPLFIFGGGAARGVAHWLPHFQRLNAASFTTYAGRGVVPDDSPLYFGATLARPGSVEVIASADLVVAVGTRLSEVDLWRDHLGHKAPMVRVDLDHEVLTDRHRAETRILADASAHLTESFAQITGEKQTTWKATEVAKQRASWRAEIDAERPGILPVADALKAAVPANTMFYSDMTQFAYAAKEVYPMDRPGHWHHPYGFGTLGYALPAAIGGKIGVGDQPVIAILGDYGFQYTVQELAVAVELELTLPIIIWDNGKLGEIEDSMVRAQIAPNAVVQRNPDFLKLAEAYGAAAAEPNDLAEFKSTIQTALKAKGPTVIRVKSDIALTSS